MLKEILLGVNVDHVATVREARGTTYPDPVAAALLAETAGADYITMHLREDRRHIQEYDIANLMQEQNTYLNLELAVTQDMLNFAVKYQPKDCCLVPEKREELTTEGGLDVVTQQHKISDAVGQLREAGIRVSLFIDPSIDQIQAAEKSGAQVVEFHTGHYAEAGMEKRRVLLNELEKSCRFAHELGLIVNAGHGLTLDNVAPVASLPFIQELNIGHAIIARAMFAGMQDAVTEMRKKINQN